MEIRDLVSINKGHLRLIPQEGDHARTLFKKTSRHGFIKLRAQFMAQVVKRRFKRLVDACLLCQGIARDPHPAPRPCGRAAQLRFFFDHHHIKPQRGRRESSRQP